MREKRPDIDAIVRPFEIEGRVVESGIFGSGHINDTFLLRTRDSDPYDYVLQRINHHIFKNVAELQENIERVTTHIRKKLAAMPGADPDREVLTLVRCRDGGTYSRDAEGGYLARLSLHRRDAELRHRGLPRPRLRGRAGVRPVPGDAGRSARAAPPRHHPPLPRHRLPAGQLRRRAPARSARTARPRSATRSPSSSAGPTRCGRSSGSAAAGRIPLRITHNDTKFNNVLLDENDRALCVTDLDTVMNGYVHYDFGDSIRTSTNTGAEDEADLDRVSMDIRLFEGYARGFLEETGGCLNSVEIDHLAFSGRLLTYIIGLRFFTDHLDGDHYFKIHAEGHNLRRARAQFKLLRSMEEQAEAAQAVVARLRRNNFGASHLNTLNSIGSDSVEI